MTGHDGNCIFILFVPNLQVENDADELHLHTTSPCFTFTHLPQPTT